MSLLTRKPRRHLRPDSVRTVYLSVGMLIGCAVTLAVFLVLR